MQQIRQAPAQPGSRPRGTTHAQGRRGGRRAHLPARRPGHPRHPPHPGPVRRKWRTVTVHPITSLDASHAAHAQLAGWKRGHWQIEVLHHIRDVAYDEDASQARTQVMAIFRNLAIRILKPAGYPSIVSLPRT